MLRFIVLCLCLVPLWACGEQVSTRQEARILLLGDSMFASNRAAGESVADAIEAAISLEVVDRSVPGARYFHYLPISGAAGLNLAAQFRLADWDVIIVNGGGNDLLFGCGCGACDGILDRLISPDGRQGAIPALVARLRATGAQVVYAGYLRNPGTSTVIKACGPAGNELDRRLGALDRLLADMTFISMADLVPQGDLSFHQIDRIHPSRKGSREIGQRIARQIAPMLTKKTPGG